MTTYPDRPSITSYVYGFLLSILLTFAAFWFSPLFGRYAAEAIVVIALLQLLVQFHFFLHLGKRSAPAWHRSLLVFALFIVVVLVGGTLWIMHNLARLHAHGALPSSGVHDLYEHDTVAPQNELR